MTGSLPLVALDCGSIRTHSLTHGRRIGAGHSILTVIGNREQTSRQIVARLVSGSLAFSRPWIRSLTRFRRAQLLERLVRSRLEHSLTAQSLDRMTRMEYRSRAYQSLIIPVIIPAIMVHSTQVDLVDDCADSSAQTRTCVLVEPKMNSAINASVGDVVGNLPE
jgi:hypothetical protein